MGGFALAALLFLLLPAAATAETYEPTRLDDPTPGKCKPKDCSLREALLAAQDGGRDTVQLKAKNYSLNPGLDEIDLSDRTLLRGKGPLKTIVSASDAYRGLLVTGSGGEVRSLMLRDGDAGFFDGGGILAVSGKLVVSNATISSNTAAAGGGIATRAEPTVIRNSSIDGNIATYGGGIFSQSLDLTIKRSSVEGNGAAEGAGIDLRPDTSNPDAPKTTIGGSTIGGGNAATNKAGGIMVDGTMYNGNSGGGNPELLMINSTVYANSAANSAGGIMGDNEAKLDIRHSTIAFNRARSDNSGTDFGGGLYQHGNADFAVNDSVLSGNDLATVATPSDCAAEQVFSGAGNALTSESGGCDVSFTTPFNVYSASPLVSGLADNGGPTNTMALTPDSAAIGFANACPKRDQRGKLRPKNCDSGSFENKPKKPH